MFVFFGISVALQTLESVVFFERGLQAVVEETLTETKLEGAESG